MKNNIEFIEFIKEAKKNNWKYCLGAFGNVATASFIERKRKQYDFNNYAYNIGKLKVNNNDILGDCYGLLKAYLWGNNSGQGHYVASQDINQDMSYQRAIKKGDISTIPPIVGLCVGLPGHVGYVIDCSDSDYNNWIVADLNAGTMDIRITKLNDNSKKFSWQFWWEDANVEYKKTEKKEPEKISLLNFDRYDVIEDNLNYAIIKIYKKTIEVGSKVKVKNTASHYATGQLIPEFVKNMEDEIIQIKENKILLKNVYSWFYITDVEQV